MSVIGAAMRNRLLVIPGPYTSARCRNAPATRTVHRHPAVPPSPMYYSRRFTVSVYVSCVP